MLRFPLHLNRRKQLRDKSGRGFEFEEGPERIFPAGTPRVGVPEIRKEFFRLGCIGFADIHMYPTYRKYRRYKVKGRYRSTMYCTYDLSNRRASVGHL